MHILGISGSPQANGTTERLVRTVLDAPALAAADTEFVRLADYTVGPCRACLGCIESNVCVVQDDMVALRERLLAADGLVIGGATYFGTLNALTHAFMERFFQFRHREAMLLEDKVAVVVGVGGGTGEPAAERLRAMLRANRIECLGAVMARGPYACFACGYGPECRVGGYVGAHGYGTPITEENTPCLERQSEALRQARELGRALYERLS